MPISTIARHAALGVVLGLAPVVASAETAEYQVTFESTWSAQTHPLDFPSGAHFSGLIGGTHKDQVSFWQVGSLASQGIQDMAELGSKTALMLEVQAAIAAGTANAVLSGGGISPSPGSVSLTFDVDDMFPLVTLVSMLAPSPDWFVGVSGLSLRANGAWVPQVAVDLVLYDAGTDSGPSYVSPNQPSMPHVPVAENTSGAFASNNHVGTFTFVRTSVLDVPAPAGGEARLELVGANPIGEDAGFRIQVPEGRIGDLAVYAVTGQRVRSLFHGGTSGQARVVTWNGRSDQGDRVPPGAYFVSLRVEGAASRTARIAVVQ
jgi:spondin N